MQWFMSYHAHKFLYSHFGKWLFMAQCLPPPPPTKTRGQPATIIPRPARVIEILQGAYFPGVSHSVLQ